MLGSAASLPGGASARIPLRLRRKHPTPLSTDGHQDREDENPLQDRDRQSHGCTKAHHRGRAELPREEEQQRDLTTDQVAAGGGDGQEERCTRDRVVSVPGYDREEEGDCNKAEQRPDRAHARVRGAPPVVQNGRTDEARDVRRRELKARHARQPTAERDYWSWKQRTYPIAALPNGSRLSCSALVKDQYPYVRCQLQALVRRRCPSSLEHLQPHHCIKKVHKRKQTPQIDY